MVVQEHGAETPRTAASPASGQHMPPPEVVDIQLFLDDYKTVDGILLPHHFSRSIDGKPAEEMTFKTIRIESRVQA